MQWVCKLKLCLKNAIFLASFWEKQPRVSVNTCFGDKSCPGTHLGCSAEMALMKVRNDCFPLEASVQYLLPLHWLYLQYFTQWNRTDFLDRIKHWTMVPLTHIFWRGNINPATQESVGRPVLSTEAFSCFNCDGPGCLSFQISCSAPSW